LDYCLVKNFGDIDYFLLEMTKLELRTYFYPYNIINSYVTLEKTTRVKQVFLSINNLHMVYLDFIFLITLS